MSQTLIDKLDKESENTINKHDILKGNIKKILEPPKQRISFSCICGKFTKKLSLQSFNKIQKVNSI